MSYRNIGVSLTFCSLILASSVPLLAQPAPQRNAALGYWMAFALMQDPPADKSTADLLEAVAAGRAVWDEGRMAAILDANQEAIQTMQRATRLQRCDWGLDYDLGFSAPVAHLPKARVLGRLNVLAGMRLAARGQLPPAVDTWLAGVRFSQHLAEGSTLISLLTARVMLTANLDAIERVATTSSLDSALRKRIEDAVRGLPDAGFDWSAAMQREQAGLESSAAQLARAKDPRSLYQTMIGKPAPENFSVPTVSDTAAFRRLMSRVTDALDQPPAVTRERLTTIERDAKALHPFFQETIPSLEKMNQVRAEIAAEKQKVLRSVSH